MSPHIQRVSPSYVIRSLLPQPCGTFILRYPTSNDEVIAMIKIDEYSKDLPINSYAVLSIRVDETLYKYSIQNYRLPVDAEAMQEDAQCILSEYNKQRLNPIIGKFTPLKYELILPGEEQSWFLDNRHFHDMNFDRVQNAGANNQGISAGIWQCEKQNDIKIFIKRFTKNNTYFKHEFSLLKDLCHFSIITLYGQYSDDRFSYLVFEDGGRSLESICPLKSRLLKTKMKFITNVGFQISYAMMYLEKKNIIHRDLTAGNVLIDTHGFVRVADFGHAIRKEEGRNTLERSQTATGENRFQFRFLAPECLPDSKLKSKRAKKSTVLNEADVYARFSSKSDVWSFGILLVQLMSNDPHKPYPNIPDVNDIPQYVKEDGKIHPQPPDCPLDMYLILKQCWAYEAKNRISFAEVRERLLRYFKILQS